MAPAELEEVHLAYRLRATVDVEQGTTQDAVRTNCTGLVDLLEEAPRRSQALLHTGSENATGRAWPLRPAGCIDQRALDPDARWPCTAGDVLGIEATRLMHTYPDVLELRKLRAPWHQDLDSRFAPAHEAGCLGRCAGGESARARPGQYCGRHLLATGERTVVQHHDRAA